MANQYSTGGKGSVKLVLLIFVVIAAAAVLLFFFLSAEKTVCGNKICESGESCSSCSRDCGSCEPRCGDGTCQYGEDEWSCCEDCVCNVGGMICNTTSHSCVVPPISLTDEEAVLIFKNYLIVNGANSTTVDSREYIVSNSAYQGELVKKVCEKKVSDIQTISCGLIAENKTVVNSYGQK